MGAALPPYGDYLRGIIALGLRTIPRTLPAITFLYFYRLGMGLFLALVPPPGGASLGEAEYTFAIALMVSSAYIPVALLLFVPFLPVQDALLRGETCGLFEGVRRVIHLTWKFLLSQLAQIVIVCGPLVLFGGIALVVASQFESLPKQVGILLAAGVVLPSLLWLFVAALLLSFAIPALVLDGQGPIQSIRTSVGLVRLHFGGVFGRLFAYLLLAFVVAIVAAIPSTFLSAAIAASGNENPMLKIPGVIWVSTVDAFLFPFGVAALVVLYRTVAPAASQGQTVAASGTALPEESRLTTSPFPFE